MEKTDTSSDRFWMQQALALAEKGMFSASPNPRVGCVLVNDGQMIGEGYHAKAGDFHAEVNAIINANHNNHTTIGATAYVTLEPCSHWGKTPPCVNALIKARVARVVIATLDSNPSSGQGVQQLTAAGIKVSTGVCEKEARFLNRGFFARHEQHRPWVRSKIAASIDGKTALNNGVSRWITSEAARKDAHCYRASADAILTGIGTVLTDDPLLTVRDTPIDQQPLRVIVDTHFRFPVNARMIDGHPILIATCHADPKKIAELAARRVETIVTREENGHVCLSCLLSILAAREINEIHVEAGSKLNGALLHAQLIDEVLLYLSPKIVGDLAKGIFSIPELASLDHIPQLAIDEISPVGQDIKVFGRVIYGSAPKKD